MSRGKRVLVAAALLVAAIQFIPVRPGNPPVQGDFDGPPQVRAILVRSCYDCHSDETRWPWYSRVAPVSWMVAHHVDEGREKLNFSRWRSLDAAGRRRLAGEIVEEVEKSAMPLPAYLLLHGDARLTGDDLRTLRAWRP
jgi:hypothetical protein